MPAYERVNEKIVLDALTLAGLLRAGSVGECATARCVTPMLKPSRGSNERSAKKLICATSGGLLRVSIE